jgi:hypothetical protein
MLKIQAELHVENVNNLTDLNLLKPTDYVMHQEFKIQ